jgi:hypothetical protein
MELSDGRFEGGAWRGCFEGMSMTRSKPLHRHALDTCQGVTTNSKSSNHNDLPCSTLSLYSTTVAVSLVGSHTPSLPTNSTKRPHTSSVDVCKSSTTAPTPIQIAAIVALVEFGFGLGAENVGDATVRIIQVDRLSMHSILAEKCISDTGSNQQ